MRNTTLAVDISDLNRLKKQMQADLTDQGFDKLMRRTMRECGAHTRTFTSKEVRKHYAVNNSFVKPGIKKYRLSGGGGNITCTIPISGPKGHIGGTFAASGGWYGWNPKPYTVRAKILKSKTSELPAKLSDQGGQPPFRNLGGSGKKFVGKANKKLQQKLKLSKHWPGTPGAIVFTRKGPEFRAKIVPVPALSVAQMPMNRARPGIENEIIRYAEQRLNHNFNYMFK